MKKITLSILLLGTALNTFGQQIFGTGGKQMQQEVESWFPWVAGILFLIASGIAVGTCLVGDNRDVKKFITAEIIIVVAIGMIIAGYAYIKTLRL